MDNSQVFLAALALLMAYALIAYVEWEMKRELGQLEHKSALLQRASKATDAINAWEEEHPELWVDGYCEYFRTIVLEAIEVHEQLIIEMQFDCQDVIDMWYELLTEWDDSAPDGDSKGTPSIFIVVGDCQAVSLL